MLHLNGSGHAIELKKKKTNFEKKNNLIFVGPFITILQPLLVLN